MKTYIGTAGIPLSCKKRTTIDGINQVKTLGLDAFEIEFVRNIYLNNNSAKQIKIIAQNQNISLSCHAPYYLNLASKTQSVINNSKNYIKNTLNIADICGAKIIVVHAGFYMDRTKKETYDLVKSAGNEFESKAKIGIETMGRQKQFGTIEEIAKLTEECNNVAPVIDFAHIHARGNGSIKTKKDFKNILDRFDNIGVKHMHCHMTGIHYENGNEKHHLPISSNEPDFRMLADVLKENDYNVTIISESPLIEDDALLFKSWLKKTNQIMSH